jgi:hypothetical protein
MDPWLERPALWADVHDSLILTLRKTLTPLLRPRYYIAVQQRTIVAVVSSESDPMIPDIAVVTSDDSLRSATASAAALLDEPIIVEVPEPIMITEDYLQVVDAADDRVVTVIEILSPSNKHPGKDRKKYEAKRNRIFQTNTSLVEIDLLRGGTPMPFTFLQTNGKSQHYRIFVKRSDCPRRAFLYPFEVRQPIPAFSLPLQSGDAEPPIRLGNVLQEAYEDGGYDMRIDYTQPPEPPLSEADMLWAKEILRANTVKS